MLGAFTKRSNESLSLSADDVVAMLGLEPHPEGGFFREMFRDARMVENRNQSTAIYYLLTAENPLLWHKLDAAEVWHWYAGAAFLLKIFDGKEIHKHRVSGNLMEGERPQAVVPAGQLQSAQSLGEWTLVGCTVSPGFAATSYEKAATDWNPNAL